MLDRISIELSDRCSKHCSFCYNHSHPLGNKKWGAEDLLCFLRDCALHGIRAVSFGGGEPLEYDPLYEVLAELRGLFFRSITTNGLLLTPDVIGRLVSIHVEKVHVSLHFPGCPSEVERVLRQTTELAAAGIRSGVNLLISKSTLEPARAAADRLRSAGLTPDRIVYLPMRGPHTDWPTPQEVALVAGGSHKFQSISCLGACGRSPRFCSISADQRVGWCSYTAERCELESLGYAGLIHALGNLGLKYCGASHVGLR